MSDKIGKGGVSDIELDVLLLFYTFSDQYGRVDVTAAANYALRHFGYIIPKNPYTLTQEHFDFLMDMECIADTRLLLHKIKDGLLDDNSPDL